MLKLEQLIKAFGLTGRDDYDDDFIDRMHYDFTSAMLVSLSILVSFKQFGGKPIECMVPDTFTSSWEEFAEMYCFAKNTYFLPPSVQVPQHMTQRSEREISYYQWVPFILLIGAGCFQLPFYVWRLLATHSGIRLHEVIRAAKDPKNMKLEDRMESLTNVRIHLENALRFHRRLYRRNLLPNRFVRCFKLSYTSCYVTTMYLMSKILIIFTTGSFLYWLITLIVPSFAARHIQRHLELADMPITFTEKINKDINRFIHSYLHVDGMFVLRMVEIHAGVIFASDLTCGLWGSFYGIEDICCDRILRKSTAAHNPQVSDGNEEKTLKEQQKHSRPLINPTAPTFASLSADPIEQEKIGNFFYRRDPYQPNFQTNGSRILPGYHRRVSAPFMKHPTPIQEEDHQENVPDEYSDASTLMYPASGGNFDPQSKAYSINKRKSGAIVDDGSDFEDFT